MTPLTLAFVLIGLGVALMFAELLLPTSGVLTLGGVGLIALGVILTFVYGDQYTGMVTLVGSCLALPVIFGLIMYVWPRTPAGRRLMMREVGDAATVAEMPEVAGLESLRGRFGRAVSPLRPSGVVEFDGRRIDCLSEGMLIEAGTWVKCVEARAGRVIVRPVDRPGLDLENADFT
jgi:membrane-bound ClpP family serine protease